MSLDTLRSRKQILILIVGWKGLVAVWDLVPFLLLFSGRKEI